MADNVNTLFEQLLEFKWKGVPFPTSQFALELRHDIAHHKYPDRDGENLEDTGRAALHFTATIPFYNGAVPGKNETWGVLYPTGWRAFIAVAKQGDTGSLVHPELGPIYAKLESCRTVWSAERRDGVVMECTWIETVPSGVDASLIDARPSPVASVLLGALDLDAQITTINPPLPTLPVYTPDFAATMRSITALTDQVSLASQRGLGQLGAIKYRINTLENSINNVAAVPGTTVKTILALGQPNTRQAAAVLAWPIRATIEQLKSSINDLPQVIGTTGKPVSTYIVQIDTTLAAIAQTVGAPVQDLLVLNPQAAASTIVKAFTVIRYYTNLAVAA